MAVMVSPSASATFLKTLQFNSNNCKARKLQHSQLKDAESTENTEGTILYPPKPLEEGFCHVTLSLSLLSLLLRYFLVWLMCPLSPTIWSSLSDHDKV